MIALDAMGGDFAPQLAVQGAYRAARQGVPVSLYGPHNELVRILTTIDVQWSKYPLHIVDCTEVIGMDEEPSRSIKKKDSSLLKAIQAVANNQASAVVTGGNSGAALVGAIFFLKMVPGFSRPALGAFLPTQSGSVFCLDVGGNTDCKPEYLAQFAVLGHCYVQQVMSQISPRVALLSNGHERYKGSQASKKAYDLLARLAINFVGNVEPDRLFAGDVDIVVTDGFAGNIMLKTIKATAGSLTAWFSQEFRKTIFSRLLGAASKSVFKQVQGRLYATHRGGALLLGVQKPMIIAHGSSNAQAFEQAIIFAHQTVQNNVVPQLNSALNSFIESDPMQLNLSVFSRYGNFAQRVQ